MKELLREEVNLDTPFAKANKVLWSRKEMAAVQIGAGNLLRSAGCRLASLLLQGCPMLVYARGGIQVSILELYFRSIGGFQRNLNESVRKSNTVLLLTDRSMNSFCK